MSPKTVQGQHTFLEVNEDFSHGGLGIPIGLLHPQQLGILPVAPIHPQRDCSPYKRERGSPKENKDPLQCYPKKELAPST